jgi:TPP-dependent indolepyruvate ferredoxin oxidoreductase alpha subunit
VGVALEAAEKLAGEGIEAEIVDLRTLRPLDTDTVLQSLKKTNRMVVVEEGWPVCSISSEIVAVTMEQGFDDLDAPVLRVTNEDVPLPYAANLEKLALITAQGRRGGEEGHLQGLIFGNMLNTEKAGGNPGLFFSRDRGRTISRSRR